MLTIQTSSKLVCHQLLSLCCSALHTSQNTLRDTFLLATLSQTRSCSHILTQHLGQMIVSHSRSRHIKGVCGDKDTGRNLVHPSQENPALRSHQVSVPLQAQQAVVRQGLLNPDSPAQVHLLDPTCAQSLQPIHKIGSVKKQLLQGTVPSVHCSQPWHSLVI